MLKERKQITRTCVSRKKNSYICSAINLFQLHSRWLIKNFQAQIYLAMHSLNLLIGASKNVFFGLQFALISPAYDNRWRKTPQGISLVRHSFNKHSIVKHLFIETGARLCHICHFVHSTIQLPNISKTLTRDDLLWRIP